jgi:hypothetical protein
MAILDRIVGFLKPKDKIKQSDVMGEIRKVYPMYSDIDDSTLASAVAKKQPELSFLSTYEPEKVVSPEFVPRTLRDESFYDLHPDIAKTDALQVVAQIKEEYPQYKDIPDIKLAEALEFKNPEKYSKLSSKISWNPENKGIAEKTLRTVSTLDPYEVAKKVINPITQTQKQVVSVVQDSDAVKETVARMKSVPEALENKIAQRLVAAPNAGVGGLVADAALAGIMEFNGIYNGLTGDDFEIQPETLNAIKERGVSPEIAYGAGQVVGGLALLGGVGSALRTGKISEAVGKAFFRSPALARYLAPAASSGVDFAAAGLFKEGLAQAREGKMDLEKLGRVALKDTALGVGFGGINGIPNGLARVAGASAYGFGTALAEGSNLMDATVNASIMGLLTAASAPDVTKAQKIGAYKTARENVRSAMETTAVEKGYVPEQAKSMASKAETEFVQFVEKKGGVETLNVKDYEAGAKGIKDNLKKILAEPELKAEAKPQETEIKQLPMIPEKPLTSEVKIPEPTQSEVPKIYKDAYQFGKKLKEQYPEWTFKNILDLKYNEIPQKFLLDNNANEFLHEGFLGSEIPKKVRGWRYGNVPKNEYGVSRSYDYRDQMFLPGVSIMQIEGKERSDSYGGMPGNIHESFFSKRPKVKVEGYLLSRKGSDGEPLLIDVKEIPKTLSNLKKNKKKAITQEFKSLAELDAHLGIESKNTSKIVEETENQISEKLPSKNIPLGLSIQNVSRGGQPSSKSSFQFQDKKIEKNWQNAKGLRGTKLWEVIKNLGTQIKNSATRVYPEIPNDKEHADFLQIVRDQKNNKTVAKEDALRLLQNITLDLNKDDFDLFARKVILDDLTYDASQKKDLPFGFTPASLAAERSNLDQVVSKNPKIADAITKRKKVQDAIVKDLIANKIITPEQAANPDYFHHQVLDYASARNYFGLGQGIKKPRPGFAKKRQGTMMDINTDYLQAEYEYMTQALQAIRNTGVLNRLKNSKYNIKKKLELEAKQNNIEDWKELIPEGYSVWQPQKGNILFTQEAIAENFFDELMQGVLPQDLAKEYLFVGKKRPEMVLPDNIVSTLDSLNKFQERSPVDRTFDFLTKDLINLWKRWTLFNPIRVLKYNYQNTIGDLDALIAANPRALKYFNRSFREMMDHFYSDKPMNKDMRDFFERGGLTSGITVGELPELKETSIFSKFYDKASPAQQANIVKRWFRAAGKASTFRENLLRYSMYLDYLERFKTGDFGSKSVLKYGASKPETIDALKTPEDKAAQVATEVFGDYSAISDLGQKFRERLIPFYSWMEINAKRYPQMLKNAAAAGVSKAAKGKMLAGSSLKVAGSVLTWAFRATALWGLMQLWNNLRDPEAERQLSDYDRKRMHIIVGRDKDGNPMILRGQGALSDFFEWFGLNELPSLTKLLADGKIDMPYLLKQMGKAPLNKGFQSISPMYKAVVEYLSGQSYFPDVLEPRAVRDKGRQLLQNVQLEDVYDYFTGKPQKPLSQILLKASPLVRSDVGQSAYQDIQNLKRLYLKQQGKGDFQGGYFTPRSQAAYYYRLAIKYKDAKAKKKYFNELKNYKIQGNDYLRILKGLDPLAGLSKKEKIGFIKFLNSEDKEKLNTANRYYKELLNTR